MNSLDSRILRLGDTFAHRFTSAGTYRYTIGVHCEIATPDHHRSFEIVVAAERGKASKTHYVTVSSAQNGLTAEPESLHISNNDVILWSPASAATPGFAVRGASKTATFDSADLPANSMYSHAFGSEGVFEWRDVRDPKLNGSVTVVAHSPCRSADERDAYLRKLGEATLVMIDAPKAHPKKVSVALGQTVFFAVRNGHGISIVDRLLLVGLNPQPLPP